MPRNRLARRGTGPWPPAFIAFTGIVCNARPGTGASRVGLHLHTDLVKLASPPKRCRRPAARAPLHPTVALLMPYGALVVTFAQQCEKEAGIGTVRHNDAALRDGGLDRLDCALARAGSARPPLGPGNLPVRRHAVGIRRGFHSQARPPALRRRSSRLTRSPKR